MTQDNTNKIEIWMYRLEQLAKLKELYLTEASDDRLLERVNNEMAVLKARLVKRLAPDKERFKKKD